MENLNYEFELLSEKEVAKIYKINVRTLQRERSMGIGMPYVKLGKRGFVTGVLILKSILINILLEIIGTTDYETDTCQQVGVKRIN